MGTLLKEALKCLCGENRWSYAIFWKIGCQNPTLLVWEDYHYEPSRNSALSSITGVDSTDMLIKEWEGLWNFHENRFSQIGEDRVYSLLNKMMINNHVHVVGEGVVGRAAFTDFHVWILQENVIRDQYPSEILTEVLQQFSAGMQTVAAIPVLPHGVIQLGSTLTIVENMEFINDVKNLFAQLGAAPAALSSDYHPREDPQQKMAGPPLFGIPVSADSARNPLSQVMKCAPYISNNRSQEMTTSQASGFAAQPSHSVLSQNQVYTQHDASALRTSGPSSITSKAVSDLYQLQSHPVVNSHLPFNGHRGTRAVGAQVILSSSDVRLNQPDPLYRSSSRSEEKHAQSGPSLSGLTFMEQQVASGLSLQEPLNGGPPTSNNTNTTQLRSYGGKVPSSVNDSVIVSLLNQNQPLNSRNDLQVLTSNPNTTSSSTPFVEAVKFCSSDKSVDRTSNQGNPMVPSVSHQRFASSGNNITSSKLAKGKQLVENDLYQVFSNPIDQSGDYVPRSDPISNFLQDCVVSNSKREKESPKFQNVITDNTAAQLPSGDDLFDMLGLDFKSKHLYESWNNLFTHGEHPSSENVSIDATSIPQTEAVREVNVGILESGILNGTGSDHLLDAIISKVHSSSKQSSDDDMSCWTTVSSVLSNSLKSGDVNMQDKKQVKKLDFPSPLAKSQLTGSSSHRTGCSVDIVGESSQINSMYGSQISLLCEDGSTTKRDTSISTAHSKRPDESGKLNRKRLRPGENPRPRPKDRQMIQDRVKELREIVPNGAKCSIDALLERTIKHMLFLQSVTKHAEKLKHTGESKIISKDGGLLLEDSFDRGGATWAFEVGSQSMVCPIIVEDLSTPRQMLVEMLCEEQGFFLEIADIIRGLGLTILKGVMEARNDKVWVRFTVEANRDVTRMEIFLSLVHLLEQAMKSSASTSKNPENSNVMEQNTFHPPPIPVTGLSTSLQ